MAKLQSDMKGPLFKYIMSKIFVPLYVATGCDVTSRNLLVLGKELCGNKLKNVQNLNVFDTTLV